MSRFKLPYIPNPYKYLLAGLLALGLITAIVFGVKGCKEDQMDANNQLVNSGQVIEREHSQGETINAVQNANDAVRNPTSNELNSVCSHYDRNCPNGS
jgi:hypothetical protein